MTTGLEINSSYHPSPFHRIFPVVAQTPESSPLPAASRDRRVPGVGVPLGGPTRAPVGVGVGGGHGVAAEELGREAGDELGAGVALGVLVAGVADHLPREGEQLVSPGQQGR